MNTANIHRFHRFVAVAFIGIDGETVYLTADDARRLAAALQACADDVSACSFIESDFRTVSFPLSNNGSRYA